MPTKYLPTYVFNFEVACQQNICQPTFSVLGSRTIENFADICQFKIRSQHFTAFACSQTFLRVPKHFYKISEPFLFPIAVDCPKNFLQQNFCPARRLSNILVLVVEPNKSESLVIVCSNFADFFLTIYEVGATFTIY